MVEPIIIKGEAKNNFLVEGKCCICGREWKIEDCSNIKDNFTERYIDGKPKKEILNYIPDVVFCPKCQNASSFESPVTDILGVRDKYYNKEYQDILNSNEPDKIKHIKMSIYKDEGYINYYHMHIRSFLWLYWYYDSIDDKKQRDYYASLFADATLSHNENYSIKIKPNETQSCQIKPFFINEHYILINIYRKMSEFKKALQLIENEQTKINKSTPESNNERYLQIQKNLCLNRDNGEY